MLAIRLPEDVEKRLDELAKRTGRTKTFYAREAVLAHIQNLENAYMAEGTVDGIRAGRQTDPSESMIKKRGVETMEMAGTTRRRTPEEVRAAIERATELMRPYRQPGRSLVDELLTERRAEAGLE